MSDNSKTFIVTSKKATNQDTPGVILFIIILSQISNIFLVKQQAIDDFV